MSIEGLTPDGKGAVSHRWSLVQLGGDQVHHHPGLLCLGFDKLPDDLLPGALGAAGGGGVEVDHGVPAAHLRADDEHVAGEDADVGSVALEAFHHLSVVLQAPFGRKIWSTGCLKLSRGKMDEGQAVIPHQVEEKVAFHIFPRFTVAEDEGDLCLKLTSTYAVPYS